MPFSDRYRSWIRGSAKLFTTGADPGVSGAFGAGFDVVACAHGCPRSAVLRGRRLRHRTLALGLLATATLGEASTRRTHALFALAWPTMAPPLYLDLDYRPALDRARQALTQHQLTSPDQNADFRILAALAEPVVADLTRMLCLLRVQLEQPDQTVENKLYAARDKARQAMLLSGRSELGVLDTHAYRRFWDHMNQQGLIVDDQLTRRAKRTAERLLDGFNQLDRQFLI